MLKCYLLATVVRLGLIGYGQWQDTTMAVKFTDVDYYVFTDATAFVAEVIRTFLYISRLKNLTNH